MNPPVDETVAAPTTPPSGSGTSALPRFGPFIVLSELGKGGMGAVYRARDTKLDREVALKVLLPALAADPRAVARFLREARAQAKVEHDHIVPIHDASETDGVAYLVMPLLKGQSLGAALKQNRHPPLAEAVRIAREIAEGLSAAHAADLIHRDIKPGNVWLEGPARRVKILDFGLARAVGADEHDGGAPARAPGEAELTERGAVVGTPAYMSPEQARGQPVDARSDLFALGVVLYEMTTGRKPFTGTSSFDILAAVTGHEPPAACELNPDAPAELSDLIRALMAKDPDARPASAATVSEALAEIGRAVAGLPTVVAVSGAPGEPNPWDDIDATEAATAEALALPAPAPAPRRKPLLLAGGAALLVAVVAGVALVPRAAEPPKKPKDVEPPAPKTPKPPPENPFARGLEAWEDVPAGSWVFANGELKAYSQHVDLVSKDEFGDFELLFVIRMPKNSDDQFQFRVRPAPDVRSATDIYIGNTTLRVGKPEAPFDSPPRTDNAVYLKFAGNSATVWVNDQKPLTNAALAPPPKGKFWLRASHPPTSKKAPRPPGTVPFVTITDIKFKNLGAGEPKPK